VTPFDPLKAQREIMVGLANVRAVIGGRARAAEKHLAEAEAEYNALIKIARFAEGLFEEAVAKLKRLEAEAEAQGKMGSPP
jgi:hypothetical protein